MQRVGLVSAVSDNNWAGHQVVDDGALGLLLRRDPFEYCEISYRLERRLRLPGLTFLPPRLDLV